MTSMTPRRSWVALTLAVVLVSTCVLVPTGRLAAQSSAPLPIKIGYQAVASWLLFGARSLKLYEKAGLAPTFIKFTAGAPQIAAAQSQNIDVAMVGTVSRVLVPTDGLWRGAMHAFQDPVVLRQFGAEMAGFPFLGDSTLAAAYLLWAAVWVVLVLGLAGVTFQRRDL